MAVAFEFAAPVYDNGKWMSRGIIYKVEDVNGVPTTVPADGFNPVDLAVSSPAFDTVKQAWVNLAQQVDSSKSATWAGHAATSPPQKFGSNGLPI